MTPPLSSPQPPPAQDSSRAFGGLLSLASGEMLARFIAFAGTTYAARCLGADAFGILGLAAAICSYPALFVEGGFNAVGTREVALRPADASRIAGGGTLARLLVAAVALAAVAALAAMMNRPPHVRAVILFTGFSLIPLALNTGWVLKGLERNRLVAASQVAAQLAFVILLFAWVRAPNDVVLVPLAQWAGGLAAGLVLLIPLRRGGGGGSLGDGLRLFQASVPQMASKFIRTILYTLSILLLGVFLDDRAVGLYVAPYRVCFFLMAFAVAAQTAYLPAMAKAFARSRGDMESEAARLVTMSSFIGLPLVLGGIAVAEPLILFVFGPEFAGGVPAFRFVLAGAGAFFLNVPVHNAFVAADRLRAETLLLAGAAVLNAALNFALIPRAGLEGAAWAALATEAFILMAGILACRRIGVRIDFSGALRPAAAAVLMTVALALAGMQDRLLPALALGAAIYAAALTALRGWPAEIIERLTFSRRAGGS